MHEGNELPPGYGEIFPALTLLHPLDENCPYLTAGTAGGRHACNANHRFSRLMLKNGAQLKRHMPGMLRELLRILAEEQWEDLTGGINSMITHLRNFPGGLAGIPAGIELTESDLC